MQDILQHNQQSPFDQIRQVDASGNEFWSARDLAPLMGYTQWKNFETPLNRAMVAAKNQGQNVEVNFSRSRKVAVAGKMPQQDFNLSRYAAYLVAMNGDPNKPEVAGAQSYFAIQTHVAETQLPQQPELTEDQIIAQALQITTARVQELEAKVEETAPKAEAYDSFMDADGTYSVGTVAKMLGLSQNKLFQELRNHRVLISKGAMRNTPYQQYMHHFGVKAHTFNRSDGSESTSYTTRVQASGVDFIRRKLGIEKKVAA